MNPSFNGINRDNQSSGHFVEHRQLNGKSFGLYELESRLREGLKLCKIKDVKQLSERIKRTELRIHQYLDEDRISESDQEKRYLDEIKHLQVLSETVSFQSAVFLSKDLDKVALSELEDRLRCGLENCKITEMTQITERIRRTEKRIEQYEEEDRIEEAQHEMRYLCHLQLLQRIIEEMFLRKSADSSSTTSFSGEENKRRLDDISAIPVCAQKTIMELLSHFQQRLLGEDVVENTSDSRARRLELIIASSARTRGAIYRAYQRYIFKILCERYTTKIANQQCLR